MSNLSEPKTLEISQLKPLTNEQYERCREAALRRVQKRIGSRPTRLDFVRELGAIWTPLDFIALIVFVAALVISSLHIIVHMGELANSSYGNLSQSPIGTHVGNDLYAAIHQWGMIFLSEGSMILFAVLFGLTRKTWRRWVFLTLALLAAVFVVIANWQSGVGTLESIMPAVFTLGIGLNLERLIVALLKQRENVNARYLAALELWEVASTDATKHPDFMPVLRQEIWQKLTSLKSNYYFVEAPAVIKHQAVKREMERDTWAYDQGGNVSENPLSMTVQTEPLAEIALNGNQTGKIQ